MSYDDKLSLKLSASLSNNLWEIFWLPTEVIQISIKIKLTLEGQKSNNKK